MGILDSIKGGIGAMFGMGNAPVLQLAESQELPQMRKEEIVKYVLDKYDELSKMAEPYRLRGLLSMNFLQGNQFCDIEMTSKTVRPFRKRYKWESREVFNKMAPIYEARIAQLIRQQPIPYVRPATGEPSDILTAKTSAAVARDIEEYNNMRYLRAQAIAWAEILGDCFVKFTWDANEGDIIGEDENGPVSNGYVKASLVNGFEFLPYSFNVPGIENQPGCIHERAYPVEEINARYGVTLKGKPVDAYAMSMTGTGYGGLGFNTLSPVVNKSELQKHVVVYELTELPSRRFPRGAVIVVAEKQLLDFREMTYTVGERNRPSLPYAQYSCITMPTSFYSESVLWRLIPVQRAYNGVRNKKHEALNRKALGILSIEDDGNVSVEDLENEGIYPGKIFLTRPGGKDPKFIHDNISTQDFDTEEAKLTAQFEEISGVSPFASHGQTPAGMVSARAIEALREQDTARIGLTVENIHAASIRGFKLGLRLCRQFAEGARILRMIGKDETVAMDVWMASDLTSDDVIIDREDALNQSAAERKQLVKELLQYKLFGNDVDPRVRRHVLQTLELGDWENIDQMEKANVRKQMRENEMLKEGILPEAKKYDMHSIHKEEIDRMRVDSEWEQLVAQNPLLEIAADQHWQMHDMFEKQAAGEQAQMAAAIQTVAQGPQGMA